MARPRTFVPAPPVTPTPFGLLSTALVLDDLTGDRALGIAYEPAYCGPAYDALGACTDDPDFGTASASVNNARQVTLTLTDEPADLGTLRVRWGDGAETGLAPHTYSADGTYTITVTDDEQGYAATFSVPVTNGVTGGPIAGDVTYSRVEVEGVPDVVDGEPFTLYHLFKCNPVGMTEADFNERAATALRLGEGRGLERVTGHLLARSQESVDLTPVAGTGVHPVEALARLEKHARASYGGTPVLHASPDLVTVWTRYGLVRRSGNGARLETEQGSLVTSGAGYDALAGPLTDAGDPTTVQAPADGEAWAYATGQVVVHRSETFDVGPVMDRAPSAVNVRSALVQRLYTSTWECVAGAVLADLYGGL